MYAVNKLLYTRRLVLILALTLIMCLVAGCTSPKVAEVRAGVRQAVEGLPNSSQLHRITSLEDAWKSTEGECYYGRAYLIFGTQWSVSEVLDWYTAQLVPLNWSLEHGLIEDELMDSQRRFTRGEHEFLLVNTQAPGFAIEQSFDYEQARQDFTTVVVVSVDYVLPKLEGC